MPESSRVRSMQLYRGVEDEAHEKGISGQGRGKSCFGYEPVGVGRRTAIAAGIFHAGVPELGLAENFVVRRVKRICSH